MSPMGPLSPMGPVGALFTVLSRATPVALRRAPLPASPRHPGRNWTDFLPHAPVARGADAILKPRWTSVPERTLNHEAFD